MANNQKVSSLSLDIPSLDPFQDIIKIWQGIRRNYGSDMNEAAVVRPVMKIAIMKLNDYKLFPCRLNPNYNLNKIPVTFFQSSLLIVLYHDFCKIQSVISGTMYQWASSLSFITLLHLLGFCFIAAGTCLSCWIPQSTLLRVKPRLSYMEALKLELRPSIILELWHNHGSQLPGLLISKTVASWPVWLSVASYSLMKRLITCNGNDVDT